MQAPNPQRFKAGKRFKQLREAKNLTQQDIEKETKRRFGDEFAILTGQLSRIELGSFQRVNIDDVVRLGMIFGLTPNEVAVMYGLWDESKGSGKEPAQLRDARQMVMSLPEDLRAELLSNIEFATSMALAKVRERMRTDEGPQLRVAGSPSAESGEAEKVNTQEIALEAGRILNDWRQGRETLGRSMSIEAMAHDLVDVHPWVRDLVLAQTDENIAANIRAALRQQGIGPDTSTVFGYSDLTYDATQEQPSEKPKRTRK